MVLWLPLQGWSQEQINCRSVASQGQSKGAKAGKLSLPYKEPIAISSVPTEQPRP